MSTFIQITENPKIILSRIELMKLDYAVEEQEGRIHRMGLMMNIEWKCHGLLLLMLFAILLFNHCLIVILTHINCILYPMACVADGNHGVDLQRMVKGYDRLYDVRIL